MYATIPECNRISSLDFGEILLLILFLLIDMYLEGIADVSQGNVMPSILEKKRK